MRNKYPAKKSLEMISETYGFIETRQDQRPNIQLTADENVVTVFCHMDDQPFIVDTIRLQLQLAGADSANGFNAVVAVERDHKGQLTKVDTPNGSDETLESVV